jgi:16S rRNA processing protein RimM
VDPREPTVVVGRITRAHGLTGEVAVLVLSEVPQRFEPGSALCLDDGRPLEVSEARTHRGRLLVRFDGILDRTAAEPLVGHDLVVPESESPPLPEGSYWDHQLIGCVVETDTGTSLGEVCDVIHTPANDVWSAVDADGRETLIPAIVDVVASVDIDGRRIVVREVPGLTTPES